MKSISFTNVLCLLLIVFMAGFVPDLWAAATGKIAGQIIGGDTGEPLAGANIVVVGTGMGAAADVDGYFVVLNIPPGTYDVEVSMIGYATYLEENVMVNINQTTTLDISLTSETITTETVVVTAERPVVQLDVSASQNIISVESIQDRPVDNLAEVLSLEANIDFSASRQGQGLLVRGGQLNETDITIDGLTTRNERNQIANTTIGLTGIQEIELLTGGFTAEYGDIRSGMVNIISKEGSQDRYSFAFDGKIAPAQRKHYGPSPYSIEGPEWRVYAGPDALTGVTEEMVDAGLYPFDFVGWNTFAENLIKDSDPANDLTPQQALEIWKWQHRTIEYANRPDYIGDMTISGPVPFTPVTFMLSQRYEDLLLAYPMSRKNSIASTTLLNFSYRLSPTMKFSWNNNLIITKGVSGGFYGFSTGYIDGTEEGTQYALEAVGVGPGVGAANRLWYEGSYNPIENKQYRTSISLNHVINPTTFYDARIEYTDFKTVQEPTNYRDLSPAIRIGNVVLDESPRGFSGTISEQYDISGDNFVSGGGRGQDHSRYWGLGLYFDGVSQIHRSHELKAGFSIQYTEFKERREENHGAITTPFEESPSNWWYYDAQPIRIAAYLQDKMEYEGLVANLGLRLEYQDTGLNQFNLDPESIWANNPYTRDNYEASGYNWEAYSTSEKGAKFYIQPRLGISHPITATSKVFFNYGHFLQPPVADQLFLQQTSGGAGGFVPNLAADWPRTIAYELGFEVGFGESYLIRFTGFYKDVSDELSGQDIVTYSGTTIETTANTRYRDIRGVEIRMEKRYGQWFYGWIQGEYMSTSRGLTGFGTIYEDPQLAEDQANDARQFHDPGRFGLKALITLQTPRDWGPTLLDHHVLGGWRLNWNQYWREGGQELLNSDAPLKQQIWVDVINSHNTDILLEKVLDFPGVRFSVYMQVRNLFDWKGFPNPMNYNQYRESLKFPHELGDEKGNDKIGEWDKDYIELGWNDFSQFINPRRFLFGVRVNL
jgi:hypothetical protein